MNSKSYDRITERIVSLLSQGTVPWHKPWQVKTGLPRNLISQKPYRGINVFLLMAMNYESPHWLTLRQANLLGGQIKPGEKSCPVVFWKPMKVKDKESGEDRKIPFLRLYHVFNVAQCQGLKNIPPADDTALSRPSRRRSWRRCRSRPPSSMAWPTPAILRPKTRLTCRTGNGLTPRTVITPRSFMSWCIRPGMKNG